MHGGHIRQVDGEFYRVVAHYGESAERVDVLRANPLPANPEIPMGRALSARKPVHVLDVQLEPEPVASLVRQTGARTLLVTPLTAGRNTNWRHHNLARLRRTVHGTADRASQDLR